MACFHFAYFPLPGMYIARGRTQEGVYPLQQQFECLTREKQVWLHNKTEKTTDTPKELTSNVLNQ
jgi:hypothetical protein